MIFKVLRSARLLADGCTSFRKHLVEGLSANHKHIETQLADSLMLVTALTPSIGYDRSAEIANRAANDGISLKVAAVALGYLSEEEFDALVQPAAMCSIRAPGA